MPKTDRWLKIMFPIVVLCAILPWLGGFQRLVSNAPPTPQLIAVINLGEHPYYGYPPNADVQPTTDEAYWTHLMRIWSDGSCQVARLAYDEGAWIMTAWTHPADP